MSATFQEELDALVGQPLGGGVAPDPVNVPMIRHWAAAFEDANPVYTDPEAAAASRWGGIVAPPLMLQTWTMATPVISGIRERGGSPVPAPADAGRGPLDVLNEAGFTATLAVNSEFDIARYVRPGEVVASATVVESISPEKRTSIGAGHFLTWLTTYTVDGEIVGTQRFRILKFRPGGAS